MVNGAHGYGGCGIHYPTFSIGTDVVFPEPGDFEYLDYMSIAPGDSCMLQSYFYPRAATGTFCVRYVVFDGNNTLDSSYFDLCIDILTSVPENADSQLEIFPNPASSFLNVTLDQESDYRIYSIDGKMIQSGRTAGQLSIVDLTSGQYLLEVNQGMAIRRSRFVKL